MIQHGHQHWGNQLFFIVIIGLLAVELLLVSTKNCTFAAHINIETDD
jgi:hypothetical protein